MRKNLISLIGILFLFLLLVPSNLLAANISTTTCPGDGCVTYNTNGVGSAGIQITGTWVGTITFQATVDNTNYVSFRVVSAADATATGITTTTSNGLYNGTVVGLSQVRIVFTSYSSGTAVVNYRGSTQAARFNSGVSISSFGDCATTTSNTQIIYNNSDICAGFGSWDGSIFTVPGTTVSYLGTAPISPDTPTAFQASIADASSYNAIFQNKTYSTAPAAYWGWFMADTGNLGLDTPTLVSAVIFGLGGDITARGSIQGANYKSADGTDGISTGGYKNGLNVSSTITSVTSTSAASCGTTNPTLGTGALNSAGTFTVGSVSGSDCTLTFSQAAPHFWTCGVGDTTTANLMRAVPVSTTVTKVQGVMVAADVIQYACNAF